MGCLDLIGGVQRRLVNLIGPVLSSILKPLSHKGCSKPQLIKQVLPREMFQGTVISGSPWMLDVMFNSYF